MTMDFVFTDPLPPETPLRTAIGTAHRQSEDEAVDAILAAVPLTPEAEARIAGTARDLVETVRRERIGKGGLDAFLHEYALSSPEGIALMAACTESVKKRAGFGIFTSTWTTLFGPFDHADPA